MLFDDAFLSMENLMKYLKMYDTPYICGETTLYTDSEDLIATANQPTELLSPQNDTILLKHSIQDVHDTADKYWELYCRLEDEESKDTLLALLKYRLTLMNEFLMEAYSIQTPYFDEEVIPYPSDCVYADASMDADSYISDFLISFPEYKKIYVFTGSNEYYQNCKKTMSQINNLTLLPYKLGESKVNLKLPNLIDPASTVSLQIEPLDSAIQTPISFLRINSAGQEQAVLKGAKTHIAHDKPTIAVCSGNMLHNLWQIPELIDSINPDYKFYLRHYDISSINGAVFYAVTREKKH